MILASASPRRREIFQKHGINPTIIPSECEENIPIPLTAAETVMFLALQKGLWVLRDLKENNPEAPAGHEAIVSSDTVVVCDGLILGKPADKDEARSMINMLSGRSHQVLTGVCIIPLTGTSETAKCFYERSDVFFKDVPADELEAYINTPEPYDKAGAYAVQETFAKYTEKVEGDLENVIGFPFDRFQIEFEKI